MPYERPAIERRVDLASPVIKGALRPFSGGASPTWKRPWRPDDTEPSGGPPPTE